MVLIFQILKTEQYYRTDIKNFKKALRQVLDMSEQGFLSVLQVTSFWYTDIYTDTHTCTLTHSYHLQLPPYMVIS